MGRPKHEREASHAHWAASAIIEFMYLELILAKGMTPAKASAQMRKLLPFAGDKAIEGVDLTPAGFRILLPEQKTTAKLSP